MTLDISQRGNILKKLFALFCFCLTGLILVACSNDEKYLTRVDIQRVEGNKAVEEEEMIVDLITLDSIKSVLEEVHWDPKEEPDLDGAEDIIATLFYTEDEDSRDELYLYRIWYNSDDSLSIVSNNEEEGYGTLDEEYADKLINLFENFM